MNCTINCTIDIVEYGIEIYFHFQNHHLGSHNSRRQELCCVCFSFNFNRIYSLQSECSYSCPKLFLIVFILANYEESGWISGFPNFLIEKISKRRIPIRKIYCVLGAWISQKYEIYTVQPPYKFEGFFQFRGEGFLKILPFKMKGYLRYCLSQRY